MVFFYEITPFRSYVAMVVSAQEEMDGAWIEQRMISASRLLGMRDRVDAKGMLFIARLLHFCVVFVAPDIVRIDFNVWTNFDYV